jgi:tetratricopeptide (TPR) repeat protein
MSSWFRRSGKDAGFVVDVNEPASDVFEQPEGSLISEALRKPLGLFAALAIVVAAGVFAANHYIFQMKRIDDFALVGFFVGGGLLLSILLRSGDPKTASRKRAQRQPPRSDELALDSPREAAKPAAAVSKKRVGLAEPPAAAAPIPAGAVASSAQAPAPLDEDDEVGSFQRALVHYVETGDLHGQGEVLRRLGHLAKARGHLRESREFYMKSRNCFRKIDDHYAEAAVLLDLGQALESLGDQDAASAAYRDANRALLDVAMSSGDRYNAVQAHAAD